MKNFLKRFLILLGVFVLGVAGTSFLMNSETTDDRSDMKIHLTGGNGASSEIHSRTACTDINSLWRRILSGTA